MNHREGVEEIILLNAKNVYPGELPLRVLEAIRLHSGMNKRTFYDVVAGMEAKGLVKAHRYTVLGEGGKGGTCARTRVISITLTSHQTIEKNLKAPGART
jgi:hypothetical protein